MGVKKRLHWDRKISLGESTGWLSSNCYTTIENLITGPTASPRTSHFLLNHRIRYTSCVLSRGKLPNPLSQKGWLFVTFWGWTSSTSRECQHFCEQGFKLRLADNHFLDAIQEHAHTTNTAFCTVCIRTEMLQMLDLKIPRVKGLLYSPAVGIPSKAAPHPETSHLSHCLQAGTVHNSAHLSNSGSKCTKSAALQPTLKLLG